jgi:hypothetical protein
MLKTGRSLNRWAIIKRPYGSKSPGLVCDNEGSRPWLLTVVPVRNCYDIAFLRRNKPELGRRAGASDQGKSIFHNGKKVGWDKRSAVPPNPRKNTMVGLRFACPTLP